MWRLLPSDVKLVWGHSPDIWRAGAKAGRHTMVQLYSWLVSDLRPGDLRSGKAQAEAATHWLASMWLTATLCTCKRVAASASPHHPSSHRGRVSCGQWCKVLSARQLLIHT